MLLVDRAEKVAVLADALRRSEEQVAARLQRVVECGDHLVLQTSVEIDQQVATGDEVHPREGRIADDTVGREDAKIAHLFPDNPTAAILDEEPLLALGAQSPQQLLRVAARARDSERGLVNVGCEDLDARHRGTAIHPLANEDAQGVHLFAGRTTGNPNPDRLVGSATLEKRGDHPLLERAESLAIAKESCDIDQQIAEQGNDLGGVSA